MIHRRFAALAAAIGASLLLAACMLSPGTFNARLDLRKDGRFSYVYTGEIYMLGLSKLAELGRKSKSDAVFEAQPCFKEGEDVEERPCTRDELASQRADWDAEQKRAADKEKEDAEFARAMLGGIDPSNPKAAEELADRLRRQAGWKSVVYKGDGLFQVDFAISGRIDHDFAFPTIERMPMANAFVMVNRRADGAIRVDAPGFGPAQGGSAGMSSLTQLAAMGAAMEEAKAEKGEGGAKDAKKPPRFPVAEGTFVLTTDGAILANNTDNGPVADTAGQRLEWNVNARNPVAPMALVKLGG